MQNMQPVIQKIVRKSGYLLLMLGLCGIGIRVAVARNEIGQEQAALQATKGQHDEVVFVLDAGHGESTKTESCFLRIFDVFIISHLERFVNRLAIKSCGIHRRISFCRKVMFQS